MRFKVQIQKKQNLQHFIHVVALEFTKIEILVSFTRNRAFNIFSPKPTFLNLNFIRTSEIFVLSRKSRRKHI